MNLPELLESPDLLDDEPPLCSFGNFPAASDAVTSADNDRDFCSSRACSALSVSEDDVEDEDDVDGWLLGRIGCFGKSLRGAPRAPLEV